MKEDTLTIKTVHECNCCLGCKTLHPQVSIIDLGKQKPEQGAVQFDFYAILLTENDAAGCCCGRKYYDYSTATMVFLTPGAIFKMNEENAFPDKGRLLAFHPDLLFRTTLNNHMNNYTFFHYTKQEALHLSLREKAKVTCCLQAVEEELQHAIDSHSKTLLSRHIELLLDYCARFYERQFITREDKNKLLIAKLEELLDDYIRSGKAREGKLPSPEYCAEQLCLSPRYLDDLLRFETGRDLHEYGLIKRLGESKKMLLSANNTAASVARWLGFPSVQYFSLLFKKINGVAPNEYRATQN